MTFEIENDYRGHAVLCFRAFFIVRNTVPCRREDSLWLSLCIVGQLALLPVANKPDFRLAHFHPELGGGDKRQHNEARTLPHTLKLPLESAPEIEEVVKRQLPPGKEDGNQNLITGQ